VEVQVIRGGNRQVVGTRELVVGDIVHLEVGNKILADGIVLRCNDFKTNESALTGESDDINKNPATVPFLLSGSTVAAGTADYVVTAVGVRSMQGSIMQDTAQEGGDTPLQVKLDKLASRIGYVGVVCALGTFAAMMAIKASGGVEKSWLEWVVYSFIYCVTIIVVAIPEGLPLAVTISLAYSTRKMLADQNLIRHLSACETMGGATDICSDKTGTLTENRMTVVQAWVAGGMVRAALCCSSRFCAAFVTALCRASRAAWSARRLRAACAVVVLSRVLVFFFLHACVWCGAQRPHTCGFAYAARYLLSTLSHTTRRSSSPTRTP
jgi:calcium-translocating P-type ATPase